MVPEISLSRSVSSFPGVHPPPETLVCPIRNASDTLLPPSLCTVPSSSHRLPMEVLPFPFLPSTLLLPPSFPSPSFLSPFFPLPSPYFAVCVRSVLETEPCSGLRRGEFNSKQNQAQNPALKALTFSSLYSGATFPVTSLKLLKIVLMHLLPRVRQGECGEVRKQLEGGWFSPSTLCLPGIKFRRSGLAASGFPHSLDIT